MAWLNVKKIKSSLLWIDGRAPAGSGIPGMLPAGSTMFLLVFCVLQFLCLKGMEVEDGNNLNAAGAVVHWIFGQCRVYSFRWSFLQLQQCSSALPQVRNKLWTMFREEKRVHYNALDNLKPFLTSLMQSLARWLYLSACCCFYYVCFLFSPTTCLIPQIILQQTFLSLKWP